MNKVAVLHIGKTGGTSLKSTLKKYKRATPGSDTSFVLCRHPVTFMQILKKHPEAMVVFSFRDPVERFISAFNSRLRQGRPRHDYPWTPAEAAAFAIFQTPNALAEALSSEDEHLRASAALAMHCIRHVKDHHRQWLRSPKFLENNKARILYAIETKHLDLDYEVIRAQLGIPEAFALPADEVGQHRTPDTMEKTLSAVGKQNITEHYAKDYEILKWCRKFRKNKIKEMMDFVPESVRGRLLESA